MSLRTTLSNWVRLCVQRRLVCSAGVKPAGAKVRRPVAWMAGGRETETLKPIDKVSLWEITSHRAVMRVNAKWPRNHMNPRAEPANEGRRQHGVPKSDRRGILISAGWIRFLDNDAGGGIGVRLVQHGQLG